MMLNPFRSTPPTATIENDELIVHYHEPFNAEPPRARLRATFITPRHGFHVRSHGAIPVIDSAAHRLRIEGMAAPLTLSVQELRAQFPVRTVTATVTVTATLQCAGNRRADMQQVRPISGAPWAPGAIGTAEWIGVRLADVLYGAGADTAARLHVAFESADACGLEGKTVNYGASIPMTKALCPEVLLAFKMNGERLEAEHSAPFRVVTPEYAGVRSPKWLHTITVQDRPSDNPMQADDYKLFPPDVRKETADPRHGMTINTPPVTSAICVPAAYAGLPASRAYQSGLPVGPAAIRGYAIASNRLIVRVDVSPNGCRTWQQAWLDDNPGAPWTWTFWHAAIERPPGEHELAVRTWDEAGQTQPARPDETWNVKGYFITAWHRVRVVVG